MRILFCRRRDRAAGTRGDHRRAAPSAREARPRPHHRQRRERGGRLRPHDEICNELFAAGADVLTTGNHWLGPARDHRLHRRASTTLLRPHNYPQGHARARRRHSITRRQRQAGAGDQRRWAGCSWTRSTIPSPRVERELASLPARRHRRRDHGRLARRGDHREDGDGPFLSTAASRCVVGTHSHVPTADRADPPGRHRLS